MKIFIAALVTETNTFSPIPTGRRSFMGDDYFRTNGSRQLPRFGNIPLIEWRRVGEGAGHEFAESISSFAQPGGTTLRGVYEELRDLILADLASAGPVDVILLYLHGAMVAGGYDDCEGDLLSRIRDLIGRDVSIGVELDLHCHLTEMMRTNADVIITFKEFPHTDIVERAREVYALTVSARLGRIKPVIAYYDCRMINLWRTTREPMRSFVRRMQAAEGHNGILSVSFAHGFPWADVTDVGAKVAVISDGDMEAAVNFARQLGQEIWDMRNETPDRYLGIDEAIDSCLGVSASAPVVLADVADNAGGGAPSDNTAILLRLMEREVTDVATGCYWDPMAVTFCREAGLGTSFQLRIGGKCGATSNRPVDLSVTVRGLSEDHRQSGLSGGREKFGPSAWVSANGIDIIIVSIRNQTFSPDAFTGLGCSIADKRIVVVKSTQHFYAAFSPIASAIHYVAASGALTPDFASIEYMKRSTNYWPRVADPCAIGGRRESS